MTTHNDYVMPGGRWATIAPPKALARLDQQLSEAINGDEGGTWAPSSPIAIGGNGIGLRNGASTLTGGVRTGRGYTSSSLPRIQIQPTAGVPTFSAPRTRKVILHPSVMVRLDALGQFHYNAEGALVSTGTAASTQGLSHHLLFPQLRFHNGATIDKITFRWALRDKPTTLPAGGSAELFWPRAIDKDMAAFPGAYWLNLHTDDAGGDPIYASGNAWSDYADLEEYWNDGRVKTLEFVPDINTVIDTDAYIYSAYVFTYHTTILHSVELELSGIADRSFE